MVVESSDFVQQNCSKDVMDGMCSLVTHALHASYVYFAMSGHFARAEIGLRGFAEHFFRLSGDKRMMALALLEYLSRRGVECKFEKVKMPPKSSDWPTADPVVVVEDALKIERWLNARVISVHFRAHSQHDPSCMDFLDRRFIQREVSAIRDLGDTVTRLRLVGNGMGTVVLDGELMSPSGEDQVPSSEVTSEEEEEEEEEEEMQEPDIVPQPVNVPEVHSPFTANVCCLTEDEVT